MLKFHYDVIFGYRESTIPIIASHIKLLNIYINKKLYLNLKVK